MCKDRVFRFGKYKGQSIKYIILTHIGYVMWCFENLSGFVLDQEEQALYDAIAIMSKKYNLRYIFPSEQLYKHIKDKDKLTRLETPFFPHNSGKTAFLDIDKNNPICRSVEKYITWKHNGIRDCSMDLGVALKCFTEEYQCGYTAGVNLNDYEGMFPSESDIMGW